MNFGRSLFGGVLAGLIMVSGAVGCAAHAAAVPEVRKVVVGIAPAYALPSAFVFRQAGALASAMGLAHGVAVPKVDYLAGSALAVALATVTGHAQVDFSAQGDAHAHYTLLSQAFRKTRARPLTVMATAQGEADGATYELAYGRVALGKATAFGTTYYVGTANGLATATVSGTAANFVGGKALAAGVGEVEAFVLRAGGAQADGHACATMLGDAGVTRQGVRAFELVGAGQGVATAAVANTKVHQNQSLLCTASASASVLQLRGARGPALCMALARGDGLNTATGVIGAPGSTTATVTGRCRLAAKAVSRPVARAVATGSAVHSLKLYVQATARATAGQRGVEIGLTVKISALAKALAKADRTFSLSTSATATAACHGFNQVNDLLLAPLVRTHKVDRFARLAVISQEPRHVAA